MSDEPPGAEVIGGNGNSSCRTGSRASNPMRRACVVRASRSPSPLPSPVGLSLAHIYLWPYIIISLYHSHLCILWWDARSEEHTSELQSLRHLVCRLLL